MKALSHSREAAHLLNDIQENNGPVILMIAGGCCDGSAPICIAKDEFRLGQGDHLLGYIKEIEVYIADSLRDFYTNEDSFYLDVAPGRGGGFSLGAPYGQRFINRPQTVLKAP